MYCHYYQAHIQRKETWFFVAILRSCEYVAFDRTFDTAAGIFEFFVAPAYEERFCAIMEFFKEEGIASKVVKLPNRLQQHPVL